jgi:hypothetical protein
MDVLASATAMVPELTTLSGTSQRGIEGASTWRILIARPPAYDAGLRPAQAAGAQAADWIQARCEA